MEQPTRPGQRCKVVQTRMGFNKEGKSPNVGKIVYTKYRHEILAGGIKVVWRVTGDDLITYHGAVSGEADFLADWLEVQPDDPTPDKELTKELENEH